MNQKEDSFFTAYLDFLNHVTRSSCLEVALHTTDSIKELKAPRNVTKLKTFLNLRSVFKQFKPNVARLSSLLNYKVEKTSH